MDSRLIKTILFVWLITVAAGCNSFKYGYTHSKAKDYYLLITENKSDLGNKRLRYNMAHHRRSELAQFLSKRDRPDFILEFEDEQKRDGIHLYYITTDSVFIFKECKPNRPFSVVLQNVRVINHQERLTYETLRKKTVKIKRSNS